MPTVMETVFLWPNMGKYSWVLWKNVILGIASIVALVTGSIVSIGGIIRIYTGENEEEAHRILLTNATLYLNQ